MIGGRRFISGELHYPRIPPEYWRDRLRMARAMGLDTVSTYVFWNRHEERRGVYDFSRDNDVAAFVRCAQEEDLNVILRPGPYVCAEWDFGGLPAWLLRDGAPVRSANERYMGPVRTWLRRLGEELAPLQRAYGGPIAAVQLENEYGAFGSDRAYLSALRDALAAAGFCSPLFTIDQPKDIAAGSLADVPVAATFAPGDPAREFVPVRTMRPNAPLVCGEYWAGWFDHWGEPHHRLDDDQQIRDLQWMLSAGCSVNIYMFHGGTNFGFWNGANSSESHPYEPTTTSYDYDAALDEAGRPTRKYARMREVISAQTGARPPSVPAAPKTIAIDWFALAQSSALLDAPPGEPVRREQPCTMESLGQSFGYILYRTLLQGPFEGTLCVDAVRDYAVVVLDGTVVAHLDRRTGDSSVTIAYEHAAARLDILVENGGRINYGPDLPFEQKGVTHEVTLNGVQLRGWEIVPLPLSDLSGIRFGGGENAAPAFHRGTMHVGEPADTFLDTSRLGKGVLWVNGRNAGRFWKIGPQYSLYVPGAWLVSGPNEIVVLDVFPHEQPPQLRGVKDPITR